tara:strand:+ start:654 stop:956 length:303 start_codon:yes stop_codon:yes gene_type:complete
MEDEEEERMVKADGLDDAILGTGGRINMEEVLIYSYDKCVQIFVERDGFTYEEAVEWMDFNVVGAWWGPRTPIFIHEIPPFMKPEDFLEELGFHKPLNDN